LAPQSLSRRLLSATQPSLRKLYLEEAQRIPRIYSAGFSHWHIQKYIALSADIFCGTARYFFPDFLFFLKNSVNNDPQSSAKTPPVTFILWFSFLLFAISNTEPHAPVFGSFAP